MQAKVAVPATLAVIAGAVAVFLFTFDRSGPVVQYAANPAAIAAIEAHPPARVQGVVRWGRAEPIAKPDGAVRLTSYNVENLFRAKPGVESTSSQPVKPEEECRAVAAAIKAVSPDVLALQEIESAETLTWFRDTYLADLGYTHLVSIDAGDGRGIEQAVLSRFPLRDPANWPNRQLEGTHPEMWGNEKNPNAGEPIRFARSPLRVTVEAPGSGGQPVPVTLFVIHHKSGGPGDYQREAEAAGVLALAGEFQQAHPGQPVLICGDFNARPSARSIELYLKAGWKDAMGDRVKDDAAWVTHSSGRVIDYILLNEAAARAVIPETRFVLGTADRPPGMDWRNTPTPRGWASDHYPVTVDLRLN